jgi:imidazoleglycerol-phosphate dehydratase
MAKSNSDRTAQISRQTKETQIKLSLNLDGSGNASVRTGVRSHDGPVGPT